MTDAEIIKALECCADDSVNSCDNCPFEMECYADGLNLNKLSLELINRQKAEIERFKQIETAINAFWSELQKLSIAKGKETPTLEELLEYIEQVKAEAIKEFAERLKSRTHEISCNTLQVVTKDDIYNLVKEMVGDTEC